jgi:isoquinoline 1-oxidoreductase alpha subunit
MRDTSAGTGRKERGEATAAASAGLFWRTGTISVFGREGKRRHVEIVVNGAARALPDELAAPQMPLLWALRELLGLTGTKFGCGVAACGACTVLVEGRAVRSCVTPLEAVRGKRITTIEALGNAAAPHPLQRAWVLQQVPQCGYCQSGMLMAAAALLAANRAPSDADIDAAITNICRCGTYPRIRVAIHAAAAEMRQGAAAA